MSELVEIVHPNGVRAHIKERLVPGWERLGWTRASADALADDPAPAPGTADDDKPSTDDKKGA